MTRTSQRSAEVPRGTVTTLEDFSGTSDASRGLSWAASGFRYIRSSLVVAVSAAAVIVSPMPLKYMVEHSGFNWSALSDAGQTYGAASAFISALALLAVGSSLALQARQTRMMQEQAGYLTQLELFRIAYDHPEMQDAWSPRSIYPSEEWRLSTYANLMWRYFSTAHSIGVLSSSELERIAESRFRSAIGRDSWKRSRAAFASAVITKSRRQFFDVVDEVFLRAAAAPESRGDASESGAEISRPEACKNDRHSRWRVSSKVGVGITIGIGIGVALSHTIKRKHR